MKTLVKNRLARKILSGIISGLIIFLIFVYITVFFCSVPYNAGLEFVDGHIKWTYSLGQLLQITNDKLGDLLHGQIRSTMEGKPIGNLILVLLPRSLTLLTFGLLLGILLGVLKGVFDSRRGKSKGSNLKILLTIIPISLPDILIVALLQQLAIWLIHHGVRIFKVAGFGTINHVYLPVIALAILPACYVARVTAMSIESCYEQEYVKTALGKGCSNARILWNHVMKNVIGIIIESFSNIASLIICNMIVIEYMFSYSGVTLSLLKFLKNGDRDSTIVFVIVLGIIYFTLKILFRLMKNASSRYQVEESA